LSYKISGRG